jgi:hypothetical protein
MTRRTMSFQMLRLEMGGTKGGAGAFTMQMDSSIPSPVRDLA